MSFALGLGLALLVGAPRVARQDPAPPALEARLVQLRDAPPEELGSVLQAAFGEFMAHVRGYELDAARQLAEGMHDRADAPWSAMSLALVSTRAGDTPRAYEVLSLQLARTPEGPDRHALLERLGLARLGAGEEAGALGPLGSAFARGSSNAGVVLGRIALREGRLGEARAVFRTLLEQEPPQSWALRGWGLSMLPPAAGSR